MTPFLSFVLGKVLCPSFYAEISGKEITAAWIPDGYLSYRSTIDQVECRLTYQSWKGQPALKVTLENKGNVPFQPTKAGLKLGIDTYMDKYPDWFGKYFPTLMRNEKTHFYGYLQTPAGHALGIVSPQPGSFMECGLQSGVIKIHLHIGLWGTG